MPMTRSTAIAARGGPRLRPLAEDRWWGTWARRRLLGLVIVLASVFGFAGPAAPAERLALLIGNQSYDSVAPLANAAADARLLAEALAAEGFTVTLLVDANLVTLNRAIAKFGRDLRSADEDATGLFFYAGHGVQSFGTNYLLPVDVVLTDAADLGLVAVPAESILRQMASARNRQNIVILDACRNNPFVRIRELRDNGLAEMKAPTGTFLSYSTSPGAVALDGDGVNSPFTRALASLISQPGVPIEQLFREVRVEVLAKTGGVQTPWDTSSLTSAFSFRPAETMTPEELTEQQLWESINAARDPVQIVLFIRGYKDSRYAAEARALLIEVLKSAPVNPLDKAPPAVMDRESAEARLGREQEVLSAAQESGRDEDYQSYLRDFPDGVYAEAVKKEMAERLAGAPDIVARGTGSEAAAPDPSAIISFTAALASSDKELASRSIAQLIAGSPAFAPIEGMPDVVWQNKKCSACHEWTKEALCTQAGTYVGNPALIARIAHPYGGPFKEVLAQWSAQGCR